MFLLLSVPPCQRSFPGPTRKAAAAGEDKSSAHVKDQEGQSWALPWIQSAHIRETDRSNGHMATAMSSRILISDTPFPFPSGWVIRKPWSLTPGDFVHFIERVEVEAQGSKQVKSQFPLGQHCRSHSLVPSAACRVSRRETDKMSEVTLVIGLLMCTELAGTPEQLHFSR